jgi:hypothetical protein
LPVLAAHPAHVAPPPRLLSLVQEGASEPGRAAPPSRNDEPLLSRCTCGTPRPRRLLPLHAPRRFAWLSGGSGGNGVQSAPNLPGELILSAGIRTNLGAGTNEDEVFLAEKSNLALVGGTLPSASTRRGARERLASASRPWGTRRSSSRTLPPSSVSQALQTRPSSRLGPVPPSANGTRTPAQHTRGSRPGRNPRPQVPLRRRFDTRPSLLRTRTQRGIPHNAAWLLFFRRVFLGNPRQTISRKGGQAWQGSRNGHCAFQASRDPVRLPTPRSRLREEASAAGELLSYPSAGLPYRPLREASRRIVGLSVALLG